LLTALPAGFGAAALGTETVLPGRVSNRQRGATGALICALALAMLIFVQIFVQTSDALIAALLALAGLGLGMFVPANNAVIMRSSPAGSASVLGGLVNMARGIGPLIALAVRPLGSPGGSPAGPEPASAFG